MLLRSALLGCTSMAERQLPLAALRVLFASHPKENHPQYMWIKTAVALLLFHEFSCTLVLTGWSGAPLLLHPLKQPMSGPTVTSER
jgi:hypothetical protein